MEQEIDYAEDLECSEVIEVPVVVLDTRPRPIVTQEEEPDLALPLDDIEVQSGPIKPTRNTTRDANQRRRIPRSEYTIGGGSKAEIPRYDERFPWMPATRPLVQQAPVPATDMTEAHERHLNDDPGAYIYTVKCDENGGCVYKDDCPILAALDDQIFECLKIGVVPGIEIRFCEKFAPKHKWSRRL